MPIYSFINNKTGEIVEIIQSMNEKHEYKGTSGKELDWERIFHIPSASIDTKQDPFNSNQYLDRTKAKRGTYGNMLDYSKELSDKRASLNGGVDPIKEKYYQNYSKERKGARHPDKIKKTFENKQIKIDL
jgi:hypothetical protein